MMNEFVNWSPSNVSCASLSNEEGIVTSPRSRDSRLLIDGDTSPAQPAKCRATRSSISPEKPINRFRPSTFTEAFEAFGKTKVQALKAAMRSHSELNYWISENDCTEPIMVTLITIFQRDKAFGILEVIQENPNLGFNLA